MGQEFRLIISPEELAQRRATFVERFQKKQAGRPNPAPELRAEMGEGIFGLYGERELQGIADHPEND